MRVGSGYDVHRLVPDRLLVLGGIVIPFDKGLLGHSDADVILECYGHFNAQVARVPSDERVQDYMKRCIKD